MFNVRGLRKEDLIIAVKELGQSVEQNFTVVDLKKLIENSEAYEKDFEFVKEFLTSTFNIRRSPKFLLSKFLS